MTMGVHMPELYNIVRLYRVSPEAAANSSGLILRYLGQYALITRIDRDKKLCAVRFRDGVEFWIDEESLHEQEQSIRR